MYIRLRLYSKCRQEVHHAASNQKGAGRVKDGDDSNAQSPRKVLVVDDDEDIVSLLKLQLEKAGFEAYGATDGQQGIYQALAVQPDVIVLDIMMPRMDGTEVCARLTQNPATRGIPVIFVSGLENKQDELRHEHQMGSPRFILAKPLSFPTLLRRITELLAGHHPRSQ